LHTLTQTEADSMLNYGKSNMSIFMYYQSLLI